MRGRDTKIYPTEETNQSTPSGTEDEESSEDDRSMEEAGAGSEDDIFSLSALEQALVDATCGVIVQAIHSINDDEAADKSDDDDETTWKEKVLASFEEVWDNMQPDEIWNRLSIILAYKHDDIPYDAVIDLLKSDFMKVIAELKDNIIDSTILHCGDDDDTEDDDDDDTDGGDESESGTNADDSGVDTDDEKSK